MKFIFCWDVSWREVEHKWYYSFKAALMKYIFMTCVSCDVCWNTVPPSYKKGCKFFTGLSSHTCNCYPSSPYNMSNIPPKCFWHFLITRLPSYYQSLHMWFGALVVSIQNILVHILAIDINIKYYNYKSSVRMRTNISPHQEPCVNQLYLQQQKKKSCGIWWRPMDIG